ncbi:hypothetical protein [Dyella tabacisoli]|uniref:Uncharacterized protein n=1 Tax=Dyella tabacisoli TaxID=2282381 RepID=A0A369UKI5_9GAMM|nr:hypothetical protein [Dyella tabacisoli]RDD80110.1 hypothetical protein DVJ77_18360 [Dyella tabacisoli]
MGDAGWINGGSLIGTREQGRVIEGFRIKLTGECLSEYGELYMAHVSGRGEDHGNDERDTVWLAYGEYCGRHGRQIEALVVQIVPRKPNFVRLVSKTTSSNRSPLNRLR